MKTRFFLGVLVVGLLGLAVARVGADAHAGQAALDFTLPGSDGKTYHLADYGKKFVVLEWFNKDCPFSRKHYKTGNMQHLQDVYTKRGVIWFSICSSAPGKQGYLTPQEAAQLRIDRKEHSTATLLDPDGTVGKLYGAKTTPHMFVINPEGTVIYAGAIDDHNSADPEDIPHSRNYVAEALDQALAGQPVKLAYTDPYGCGVKYKD